jgi:hypothetical protein
MLALVLRTQLPAQDVKAALRVPKPMKLYSANTDQCGLQITPTNRAEIPEYSDLQEDSAQASSQIPWISVLF